MSIQVTQTLAEGLKRQFQVVVPASELATRLSSELDQLRGKVELKGFRPGKVPLAHLRRVYGRSAMAEVVQNAVTEANRKIVEDNALKLAGEPAVDFGADQTKITAVMDGKADLDFTVALETLPAIDLADHGTIELERPVVPVSDSDVDEAIMRLAEQNRSYSAREADAPAQDGDKVTIDFLGTIDGVPFEGGKAEDAPLVLGSGQFIPGFEEQLVGAKVGDARTVTVTFPADYQAANLAGKEAQFAVTVKQVEAPGEIVIDDALAANFGLETVEKLREAIRDSMQGDLAAASRQKVKRKLLDALDTLYTFDLPPSLLDQEFQAIWGQVQQDMKRRNATFETEGTDAASAEADYRKIAARRVRLGLVLAEIGEKAQVKLADEEVTQALIARARQFPGQEKQVFDFYRQNPERLAELRAPLFEEKVVDVLLGQVKLIDKPVTREELLAEEPEDDKA